MQPGSTVPLSQPGSSTPSSIPFLLSNVDKLGILDSKNLKKLDNSQCHFKLSLRASCVMNSNPRFAEDIQSEAETNVNAWI